MRRRVGIGLSHAGLTVVVVRGREVEWSRRADLPEGAVPEAVRTTLCGLLGSLPIRATRRLRVDAAVGPCLSQVKHLRGLPLLNDPALVSAVVGENLSRFFLRNGASLALLGVQPIAPGEAWAAVVDQPVADSIDMGCRDAGLRLRTLTAAAIALPLAVEDAVISWTDGPIALEVHHDRSRLLSVRRFPVAAARPADDAAPRAPAGPLAGAPADAPHADGLDKPACRIADAAALGATLLPEGEHLRLRPKRRGWSDPRVRSIRLPALVLAVSSAALLLAPLGSMQAAAAATRRAHAVEGKRRIAAAAEAELMRLSGALNEVAAFAARRRSAVALLMSLTEALPPEATLLDLQLDSTDGSAVALAPRAGIVLSALDGVPALIGVEPVGPVTREGIGGRDLERTSVHFGLVPLRPAQHAQDTRGQRAATSSDDDRGAAPRP